MQPPPEQPPDMAAEDRQRLYNAAEAFYYTGILTSLLFDASNVDHRHYRDAKQAAEAAAAGPNRWNSLGAPPIVNFGFSVELYLKLLIGKREFGHDLCKLFLRLEQAAPQAAQSLVRNHHYARGCREEFLETLQAVASVFEQWRYSHEHQFLCSSPDTLLVLANGCRKTVQELCPDLHKVFAQRPGDAPAQPTG
jgi:hypothetical protein